MKINPKHIDWGGNKYHSPSNVGAVVTYVLIMQALHDMFRFNWRRFNRLYNTWRDELECIRYIRQCDPFKQLADGLGKAFLSQVFQDIQRRLPKIIEQDDLYRTVLDRELRYNKADRKDIQESSEILYVTVLYLLRRDYAFTDADLQAVQEKIKFYLRCISDGDVRLVEFMECLRKECRQQFGALTEYKKKGYKVKIYG